MHQYAVLLGFLLLAVIGGYYGLGAIKERFSNYSISSAASSSNINDINADLPLNGEYPLSNRKTVTNNGYGENAQHNPFFQVGSYAQVTNNFKYPINPDNGQCIPAEFCGALYKNNQIKSNTIKPLAPVPSSNKGGVRVGYYNTSENTLL